jgi:1,4-alpha-glucan branching enzyme
MFFNNDIFLSEFFSKQLMSREMAMKKKVTENVETAVVTETPAKKASSKKATKATAETTNTTTVTFSLPKEAVGVAKKVAMAGEFNDWNVENAIELKKQKNGSFQTTLELETGREYQYRFILDGEVWANAWNAPKYVQTPFGVENSVIMA